MALDTGRFAEIRREPAFHTTQWTRVLAAGRGSEEELAELCRAYWYPIYAYARRRGLAPADAEDLTQEFFARVLERQTFAELSREGGKFRSFLLRAVDRLIVDEWRKAIAQKRGAGKVVSMDGGEAETRFLREPVDTQTPEVLFNHAFALSLLERVYQELKSEFSGREELFEALKPCLLGSKADVPYAELAGRLGMTEGAIKTHVHRLRARFRTLLRGAVAQIVSQPSEIDEELRELVRALAGT